MTIETDVYPTEWHKSLITAVEDVENGIAAGINEQIGKYGQQRISALAWIAVIAEEFGEMVAEYNKGHIENFEEEAYQTVACITRLIHETRREHSGESEAERDLYVRHS